MENEKKSGDKYSKLAGNTLIFAISSFSSKLLTLIVQPFLTYAMAEISDLGLSKILSQYANLLIPFVSMGMSNAIIRFGLDKGNSEKQVFTNGLLTILGGFGILVLCWPIAQFLPDMAQYGLLIYIYVLMSCLRTLCTQFVRSRQWNKLVAVDGVLCTVATMAFYVLYLVGFKWGANGYLLAIISGDFVSVLFLMFTGKLWDFIELKGINKTLWKQMLHFSLPMIPAQISFWIINASDLFFVREMCDGLDGHSGDAWSGLLSTGYFLPTILTTLGLIFYDAWQLSAVTEEEGRAKFFTQISSDIPLPNAYKVTVADLGKFDQTVKGLKGLQNVDTIRENKDLAQKLVSIRQGITVISVVIIGVLFAISLFIISNTIKLTVYSRRLEISIMKSVGATNSFVRLPFVVEGMILGIVSGAVSLGLVWGLYELAVRQFGDLLRSLSLSALPFAPYALQMLGIFVAIGIISGVGGSMITMRKYLNKEGSEISAV